MTERVSYSFGRYNPMVMALLTKQIYIFNTMLINIPRGFCCCLHISFFVVFSLGFDFVCPYESKQLYKAHLV